MKRCLLLPLLLLTAPPVPAAEEAVSGSFLFSRFDLPGEWRPAGGENGGRASLEVVAQPRHEGAGALMLAYDFAGRAEPGGVYARAQVDQPLAGLPERFTLWIHGDGSKHPLTFRFRDRFGETFQTRLAVVDWTGWKQVDATFAPAHHYGGSGGRDGVPEPPFTFWEINVDHAPGAPERGSILLDEMRVFTRVAPADSLLVTAPEDPLRYVLAGKRKADLKLTLVNIHERPQIVKARWSVSPFLDPEGRRSGGDSVSVPAGGQAELPLSLTFADRGYYDARVQLEGSLGGSASLMLPFVLIDPPARTGLAPDSPFGINGHIPDRQALALMKLAGIQTFRGDMNWEFFEPKAGEFSTGLWDPVIAEAKAANVLVLPVVGYAPAWAAASRPEGRGGTQPNDPNAYADLLERLVRRYGDGIAVWDLWNEPDLTWSGTPEEYGRMAALAREAMRRARPSVQAMFGGCSNGDIDSGFRTFSDGALKGSGDQGFDVFSVHPYSRPRSPEEGDLRAKLQAAVEYVGHHGGKRPVWITEVGWPTADDTSSVPEALQAAYLVRTYVLALSVPGVEKVFWYQLFSGTGTHDPEEQYGILRAGLRPKPAYAAYAHMTHQLEGSTLDQVLRLGSSVQGYTFRSGKGLVVAVLWSTGEPVGLAARLPAGTQVTAIDGRTVAVRRGESLPLSATPIYVRFTRGSSGGAVRTLEGAELLGVTPLALAAGLTAEGKLAVRLTNRLARPVAGDVGARAEGDWGLPEQERAFSPIPSGWTTTVLMDLELPKSEGPARLTALVVARTGEEFVSARVPLHLMTARRPPKAPAVDGNLGEWAGIPTLLLGYPEAVAPASARGRWRGPDDLSADLAWAWDDRALYLGARVKDDTHSQRYGARDMWQGDSLQVAFDAKCDAQTATYDGNDSELGLGLVEGKPAAYRWVGPQGTETGPAPGVSAAIRREGTETRYEAAIPWEELGVSPKPGMLLGVCVLVNEDDGAGRDHWLETGPGIGESKDPRGYWRLRLGG